MCKRFAAPFGAAFFLFGLSFEAAADDKLKAVASFSILGDMVKRIGGSQVAVTTLVGPGGDAHVYQPTPADARAVSEAKLLFVNGLDFEGWLDRLIEASAYDGVRVEATDGIEPIAFEDEEHHDGHAEQVAGVHPWTSGSPDRSIERELVGAHRDPFGRGDGSISRPVLRRSRHG